MVSEGNLTDGLLKTRPILSDVTNRPAKRSFSSTSADSIPKSGDWAQKKCKVSPTSQLGRDKVPSQQPQENPSPDADASLHNLPTQNPNSPRSVTEEQSLLGDGFFTSLSGSSLGFGEDRQRGTTLTELCTSDDRDEARLDDKSKPPTIVRNYDFPGLEQCSALFKGVSTSNPVVNSGDLLKHCTCTFCSKAAYIWTDLHYQDVKGRIGALKKSQKEASTMLQKFNALKEKVIHDPQSSAESSKLELSLMEQWKSLFVHMENTFAQENKQLESRFDALKDLRANCKNDLDQNDNSHSDNR